MPTRLPSALWSARLRWRAIRGWSALSAVALAACTDPVRPVAAPSLSKPSTQHDVTVLPNGVPLGIGGAFTLNVSGPYVTRLDPAPSGITMFPGIPVVVTVAGQITRRMTPGFLQFCSLFNDGPCPAWLKSNDPFGPGGVGNTSLGAATAWWDTFYGAYYYTSPGGNAV